MPTVDSGIAYYYGTLLSQVCHLSRPGPQLGAAVSAVPLVIACKMAELLMKSAIATLPWRCVDHGQLR